MIRAFLPALMALLVAVPAAAQEGGRVAPPMFGIAEIVVQWVNFSNPKAAQDCNLSREAVMDAVLLRLQEKGLPAVSVAEAKPTQDSVARLRLVPEVSTLRDQLINCISYIQLRAEEVHALRVPPITPRKNVKVQYWQFGGLIMSALGPHPTAVEDGFTQLATMFADEYRLDQPTGAIVPTVATRIPDRAPDAAPPGAAEMAPAFPPKALP